MHDVVVESATHGGHGVCRIDGRVCFIPHGLPGDRLRISVSGRRRGVLWGAIEAILEPSEARQATTCSVFGRCGGCSWLHFAYPAQAEWKRRIVRDCMQRIGKIEVETRWLDNPALRLHYRTRAAFHGDGHRWGFYETGSHQVAGITHCPLCHPRLNDALEQLSKLTPRGTVEITVNPEGEETLVWTKTPSQELHTHFDVVEGPRYSVRSSFMYDGVPIVNGAFSQSSLLLNRILVDNVRHAVGNTATVLDLYCGNGNLSMGLGGEVLGLDHQPYAIAAADATRPGSYRAGNEEDFACAIGERAWEVILLDPPRAGAKSIMPVLAGSKAGEIVYVSCDPATFARDAAVMVDSGWTVEDLTVLDLFPHTPHVETMTVFRR